MWLQVAAGPDLARADCLFKKYLTPGNLLVLRTTEREEISVRRSVKQIELILVTIIQYQFIGLSDDRPRFVPCNEET